MQHIDTKHAVHVRAIAQGRRTCSKVCSCACNRQSHPFPNINDVRLLHESLRLLHSNAKLLGYDVWLASDTRKLLGCRADVSLAWLSCNGL